MQSVKAYIKKNTLQLRESTKILKNQTFWKINMSNRFFNLIFFLQINAMYTFFKLFYIVCIV